MPNHDNSSLKPKKHKVIHWNPEDDEGQETTSNANKKLAVGGGIAVFAIIFFGLLGYFALTKTGEAQRSGASGETSREEDVQEAFASRSKADFARETTTQKLDAARQMPVTHPVLTQMLIAIAKEDLLAKNYMQRSSYAQALEQYNRVSDLIDDFSAEVENKKKSRELYDNFLVKVESLEKGRHLNETAYQNAFTAASAGKEFLDVGSFTAARQKLDEATDELSELENSIQDEIKRNAANGYRFIATGQGKQAIDSFMNVLKLDPDNEEALPQIERAQTADVVYNYLVTADNQENQGLLEDALESYKYAVESDSLSTKAQQGLSRVRRKIENRDFTMHYQSAEEALENLQYQEAISHFQAALEVFPTRTDILETIKKARVDKHKNDIVTKVTRAYELEREFRWAEARAIYTELIQMEPDLQEGTDGLLRTGKMLRSILRYEKLIEVAKAEAKSHKYQAAIRSYDQAMSFKPQYIKLNESEENLRKFLEVQSKPVQITIISDNTTYVSIQGPTTKQPKKFDELTLSVLPGRYYIKGRRNNNNYEDVSITRLIRGGETPPTFSVICSTKRKR